MKKFESKQLIYSTERPLFITSAIISGLVWGILTLATFGLGLVYAGLVVLGLLCAHGYFLASIKGYGIRVSESQFPEIHKLMTDTAKDLGMKYNLPEVYIYHLGGIFNAFATHFVSRDFIILTTEAVEACGNDKNKLKFLVAHELTHLYRKHTRWNAFLGPSRLIPYLGDAYSKACEYTCDAHAAYFGVKDLDKSIKAVSMLATVNSKLSDKINFEALETDTRSVSKEFWATVMEINSTHPMTGKRVLHLQRMFGEEDTPEKTRRSFFGIIMAGFFNLRLLIVLYIVIVLVAVMMTSLTGYREKAEEFKRMADEQNQIQINWEDDESNDYVSPACQTLYDAYHGTEIGSAEEDAAYDAYDACEAQQA